MSTTTATIVIDAPVSAVFPVVADVQNFRKAVPSVIDIVFTNDIRNAPGSTFRETRVVAGREAKTDLEIIEYVANDHVRLVFNTGGTHWDSVFTTTDVDGKTRLDLVMEATPKTLRGRMTLPLVRPILKKALMADMEAVKAYVEADRATP